MNDSPISDEVLWRVVDILARQPENKNADLFDLVQLAVPIILESRKIAERVAEERLRNAEGKHKYNEMIYEEEAARLVVANDRNKGRRIKRFREFVSYLMQPGNKLEPDSKGRSGLNSYLELHKFPPAWVDHFKILFPKWVKLKKALSQSGRKKKSKKMLALLP